jgi:hypothetical protein
MSDNVQLSDPGQAEPGPALYAMTDTHGTRSQASALPAPTRQAAVPVHLERLAETARDYARGAKAAATQRAYGADRALADDLKASQTAPPSPTCTAHRAPVTILQQLSSC